MYHIGKITNTHGIKGEVKIYNLSDFNRFFVGATIYIMQKGQKIHFEIERVRNQQHMLIVKFKGFDNINDILPYKGLDVYTDQSAENELASDDYHYQSLIGKAAYTDKGEHVGTIVSVIEVPQGHLLEIEKTDGKKALVPFVGAFIQSVEQDRVIITPIEGLL